MDALDGEASLLEFMNLIVHQCDEWTNHKSRSTSRQSWKLVAKRLARPSRHDKQGVLPRRDRFADVFLVGPELGEAERVLQKLSGSCEGRYVPCNCEFWRIGILG